MVLKHCFSDFCGVQVYYKGFFAFLDNEPKSKT